MVVSVGVSDVYAPFGPVPKFAVRRDGGKLVGRFEDHDPFNGGDGGKTELDLSDAWNMEYAGCSFDFSWDLAQGSSGGCLLEGAKLLSRSAVRRVGS